jgi:zinc transport system substrate-binding protein
VAIAKAKAYFRIGVAFEEAWLPRMQVANPSMRIIDMRSGIRLQPMTLHDLMHDMGSRPADDTRPRGMLDPHIWTSPPLVKRQAATVRDALIALVPEQRARFEAGYARFAADLDALDADIRRTLAGAKERRFMVFHPAWGYFASTYGLQQIPIEVEGKEPGSQTLARIIDAARREHVRVVFVQTQFSKTAAAAVARSIGGEVVQIDPLAEDFLANTRAMAHALAKAMR